MGAPAARLMAPALGADGSRLRRLVIGRASIYEVMAKQHVDLSTPGPCRDSAHCVLP